mmetsp:Transcript_23897/g.51749  ORF Transcript_23897/g.51749 Transcript_23897/m.51749 type:complete len:328 (+) Transcript_23897:364-1347(+)
MKIKRSIGSSRTSFEFTIAQSVTHTPLSPQQVYFLVANLELVLLWARDSSFDGHKDLKHTFFVDNVLSLKVLLLLWCCGCVVLPSVDDERDGKLAARAASRFLTVIRSLRPNHVFCTRPGFPHALPDPGNGKLDVSPTLSFGVTPFHARRTLPLSSAPGQIDQVTNPVRSFKHVIRWSEVGRGCLANSKRHRQAVEIGHALLQSQLPRPGCDHDIGEVAIGHLMEGCLNHRSLKLCLSRGVVNVRPESLEETWLKKHKLFGQVGFHFVLKGWGCFLVVHEWRWDNGDVKEDIGGNSVGHKGPRLFMLSKDVLAVAIQLVSHGCASPR